MPVSIRRPSRGDLDVILRRASSRSRKRKHECETLPEFRSMVHSATSRDVDFEVASSRLFDLDVHEKAGLTTVAVRRPVRAGDTFVLAVRLAGLWVTVANLVTVADKGTEASLLSYLALDEHVEEGEQTFFLKRLPVGVSVEVASISRSRLRVIRLLPWIGRIFQERAASRYVDSWLGGR